MKREGEVIFTLGNDAMTAGAIAAGARFYAGYPITPSSEVAELSSIRLPAVGGIFVQMEDELGSIAAIIGASLSGLFQENFKYNEKVYATFFCFFS